MEEDECILRPIYHLVLAVRTLVVVLLVPVEGRVGPAVVLVFVPGLVLLIVPEGTLVHDGKSLTRRPSFPWKSVSRSHLGTKSRHDVIHRGHRSHSRIFRDSVFPVFLTLVSKAEKEDDLAYGV